MVATSRSRNARCSSENAATAGELDDAEQLALEQHRQHHQVGRRRRRPARSARSSRPSWAAPTRIVRRDSAACPTSPSPGPKVTSCAARHVAVRGGQPQPHRRRRSSSARKNAPSWASTSGVTSVMIMRQTSPRSRWPCSRPPMRARLESSQPCSAFFLVVSRRVTIIWLMLSLSSATSPCASTAIRWVRSPRVTAVDTWAIARSCVVSVEASWLTFSVRSRQVPETPLHLRLAAELALDADLAGHPGDLVGERRQLVDHRVDGVLQLQDLALGVDRDLLRQVALRHGGGHRAMLRTWAVRLDAMS